MLISILLFVMTFSRLVTEGRTSCCHVHVKGLHLGGGSIHIKNISSALEIGNGIWSLVIFGARCIGQSKLRVFLAELLSDLFKIFTLLLVSGEFGADVFSAAINTTSSRTLRYHTCRSTTDSRVSIARVLLSWLIWLALFIHYFLSVERWSWARIVS